MKKTISVLLAAAFVVTTLAGCGNTREMPQTEAQASAAAEKTTAEATSTAGEEGASAVTEATKGAATGAKIGLSLWGYDNQYWVEVRAGAQKKCDELGIELVIADPNNNTAQQVSDIENFMQMDVDAMIVAAIDPTSVESVLKEAMDKGIKVVAQSIEVKNCDVYSSADEYEMGYVVGKGAGQWIADNYGADAALECAVLNYDSNPSCIPRGDGLEAGIKELAPKAVIAARQDASTTADGQRVTDSLLQANPKLQVIICQNDSIALGALSAVQGAGKDNEEFYIGGLDNTDEARAAIKAGTALRATLDNTPNQNGIDDVILCKDLIDGKTVDPRFVVETSLVTYTDVAK